jgi:predicted nucleotidyltransferase
MPTALELGPGGWEPYIKRIRGRVSEKEELREQGLRDHLFGQAQKAARDLKMVDGARRVVLFGSLAHQAWFHSASDVDLAVEGMLPGAYWAAWRRAEKHFPGRKVDLVEYETASESLRRAIDSEGIEL